jgi:hypothetical protein
LQPNQGVGVMLLGGFQDREFDIAKQSIIMSDE